MGLGSRRRPYGVPFEYQGLRVHGLSCYSWIVTPGSSLAERPSQLRCARNNAEPQRSCEPLHCYTLRNRGKCH